MRIKLTAEIDISDVWCSIDEPEEVEWFMDHVLQDELLLHSNLVGDEIGFLENVTAEIIAPRAVG